MGFFLAISLVIYYPILFDHESIRSFLQYLPFAIILSLGLIAIYEPLVPLFIVPLLVFLVMCIIAGNSVTRLKNELFYLSSVLFFCCHFF